MIQKTATEIELSLEERRILQLVVLDPRTPERLATRMKIVLLAAEGHRNGEIDHVLQPPHGKAQKWRDRYVQRHAEIVQIELEADYKLRETIVTILSDARRRVGPPPVYRKFKK